LAQGTKSLHFIEGPSAVTIVRIGTSKKYSDNWESAFGKKKPAKAVAGAKVRGKKPVAKKTAKKGAKRR
jgi:hypothetical protein